jgi:peptidyl-prolyl cis-trans isomerase C
LKKTPCICISLVICILCAGLAVAGDDIVLARAGDDRITLSDLNRVIGYYTPEQQEAFKGNVENKVRLIKKLIQERVLAADARRLGIDKDPGVREQLDILTNNVLASELLKREVADKIGVSDAEARIYYQLHKDEYKMPETVRVRHILVKTGQGAAEDEMKAAREKAESLLKRVRAGEDFAKLAQEASDDAGSKGKGGEIGFFPRGRMVPEFEKVAFALKPGEVSGVVETKFGYHIIKCEELKPEGAVQFEEAKKGIIEKILKETRTSKVKEYVEKRTAEENVEIYSDRLPK